LREIEIAINSLLCNLLQQVISYLEHVIAGFFFYFTADLRDTGRERERKRERERVVKKPINKFTFELRPAKLPTIAASSIVFASTDQPSCSGKAHSWGRRACVDGKQNDDVFFFEGGGEGV
jgi:hypothetical protein